MKHMLFSDWETTLGFPFCSELRYNSPSIVVLVFQFHSQNDRSLTLYKEKTIEKAFTENQVWNWVLKEVAVASDHIHGCNFIHNDLKSNNVVVEEKEVYPSPVIIDLSKSVLAVKAKVPRVKPKHVSSKFSYITPELRNGTGKPSTSSDIFSLVLKINSLKCYIWLYVSSREQEISTHY